MVTLGIFAAMAAGQAALADSEELSSGHDAPTASPIPASPRSGQKVYSEVCIACHSPPGVGGAPALGDSAAWAPRIAQGREVLIAHALNGFTGKTGVMPKKGERSDLSDEEVIGAVEYMVGQAAQ